MYSKSSSYVIFGSMWISDAKKAMYGDPLASAVSKSVDSE